MKKFILSLFVIGLSYNICCNEYVFSLKEGNIHSTKERVEDLYINDVFYGSFSIIEDIKGSNADKLDVDGVIQYKSVSKKNDYTLKTNKVSSVNESILSIPSEPVVENQHWADVTDKEFMLNVYNEQLSSIIMPIKRVLRINKNPLYEGSDYIEVYEYAVFKASNIENEILQINGLQQLGYSSEYKYIWDLKNCKVVSEKGNYETIFIDSSLNKFHIKGSTVGNFDDSHIFGASKYKLAQEYIEKNNIDFVRLNLKNGNMVFSIDNIMFLPDSSKLESGFKKHLTSLAELLKLLEGELSIYGYCADVGSKESIKTLSQERADVVAAYLKKHDVKHILNVEGKGSRYPIGDNNTKSGRALNRRVEIILN